MAEPIEYRRVWQKVDTYANWMANPLILGTGEQAFVVNAAGQPVNFRIGDGTKTFANLPDWIQYDQAAYVAPVGNTLPVPENGVGYSILTEGTYNGSLVVPEGNIGIASFSGSWTVRNMALPTGAGLIVPSTFKPSWVENESTRLPDGTLLVANKNTARPPVVGDVDWVWVGGKSNDYKGVLTINNWQSLIDISNDRANKKGFLLILHPLTIKLAVP